MDTAAIPAFDDYFNAVSQMPTAKYIDPCITLETSRGCWWGAKNHCTFCGLNALGMAFRKKSPTRAVSEIREVTTRHNVYNWHATDNIIDMSYFDSVLPQLAEDDNPYRFFYETKANLKVHHLQSLVNAGCDFIQPGIESLHDETLKIMRKGTTACLNIHLLRLCVSLGIRAQWSILCGFPDSNPAWVSEVAEKFGSLHHLQPPACVNEIRFDRFSPYHSQQTTFGLELTPFEAYERIYPLDKQSLEDLAFFFEGKVAPEVHTHTAKAQQTVLKWRKAFWSSARPQLSFESSTIESARIKDTRECATSPLHELDGLEAAVLHCVDTPVTVRGLARRLSTAGWKHVSTAEIDRALDELDAHALIWRSSTQIVALPSPACQRPMASSARKGLGDVRFPEYLRDQKRFQDLFL
jgi:magnesium-protoporphyrin IX monomethyl ester (oxidative) cyclase